MSGAGGAPAWREAGGSQALGARRLSAASLPGLPMQQAHSYPGPEDEAGLLRKLLKRRSSGLSQAPPQALSSAQLRRNRDKLVSLLEEGQLSQLASGEVSTSVTAPGNLAGTPGEEELLAATVDEPSPTSEGVTGRITIYCTAASYDLKGLREHLEEGGYRCDDFPEVLYSRYVRRTGETSGDIFTFEFGTVVFWDLSGPQEQKFLQQTLGQFEEGKLSSAKVESETFVFRLLPYAKPSIQNDVITLPTAMADPHLMKIAISFALAQSTKLSVLEERALSIAAVTRKLPIALAQEGRVRISDKAVAQLMGRVFIEQAALNLLGSVLDTPDFFWTPGVGDHMQSVYDRVFDYLEMEDRIAVLNARLAVLHELLDMLRLQGQAQHSDFLEVIIIVLIFVDCVILFATLAATMGLIGGGGVGPGGHNPAQHVHSLGGLLAYAVSRFQG
ncbi:hypothetical protein ABPG77_011008 [Micractinium sp. CCAP 211/92]